MAQVRTVTYKYNSAQGTGDGKKYYTWGVDAKGNRILTDTTDTGAGDIVASYNTSNPVSARMVNPTSGYSGVNYIGANFETSAANARGGALGWSNSGTRGAVTADFVGNYIKQNYTSGAVRCLIT